MSGKELAYRGPGPHSVLQKGVLGTAGKEVTKNTTDFSHKNYLQKKKNLTPSLKGEG